MLTQSCSSWWGLSRKQDTKYKIKDTRHKTQERRHKTQDTKHKTQDTRCKTQCESVEDHKLLQLQYYKNSMKTSVKDMI